MSARRRAVAPAAAYIVDTSLYIRAFRESDYGERFRIWHARMIPRLAMSGVVLHELLVGARKKRGRHLIEAAYAMEFQRRGRLLTPSVAVWKKAADADRRLRTNGGYREKLEKRSFAHDLLIALTCREMGAILLTNNTADFELIRSVTGVRYLTDLPEVAEQ